MRFTTLDAVKATLIEPGTQAGPVTNLVAGIMAGTLEATLVVAPVETVKTRLVDADKGLLRGVYSFVQAEGLAGIYRGLFATVCKSAANQALRFVIFGEYRRLASRAGYTGPAHEMPSWLALGGGMVAGALGSLITMPFDVLKTKMQGLRANRHAQSTRSTHRARAARAEHAKHAQRAPSDGGLSLPPPSQADIRARCTA